MPHDIACIGTIWHDPDMPRSFCPDDLLTPRLFAPLSLLWTVLIWTIFLLANLMITAAARSVPSTAYQASLAPLAEWVRQTGKPTVMRAPILRALGLPRSSDLSVLERGFRDPGEQLTHVCSVSSEPGLENVVFVALVDENDGNATVWRAERTGQLTTSVRFVDGQAKQISNAETEVLFTSEKAYLLKQMRGRSFRTGPSSNTPAVDPVEPPSSRVPINLDSKTAARSAGRASGLSSEFDVLLVNAWVTPVLVLGAAMGVYRVSRSRRPPFDE